MLLLYLARATRYIKTARVHANGRHSLAVLPHYPQRLSFNNISETNKPMPNFALRILSPPPAKIYETDGECLSKFYEFGLNPNL